MPGNPYEVRKLGVREPGVSRRGAVEQNWLRGLSRLRVGLSRADLC